MSKATTIQKIKDNVYDNVNNEITGQMAQDAMVEIVNDTYTELSKKQDKLVSGTNIKTIAGQTILGSGNITLSAGSLNAYTKSETDALLNTKVTKTTKINDKPLSGNITLTASDVSALPSDTKYAVSPSVGGAATSANKVNSTLTIQTNGTTAGTFNGSANLTVNVTPANIGAATTASVNAKQDTLVSGTNIKTINSTTLLGSGNINLLPLTGGTITGNITANSFIKSGGTNQQVLLANGTVTTIDDLRAPIQLTNEDLNTYTVSNGKFGIFFAAQGNTCTNVPSDIAGNGFSLEVIRSGASYLIQRIYHADPYKIYSRIHTSIYWTEWNVDYSKI